jgi:hypothetical protein
MTIQSYLLPILATVLLITNFLGAAFTINRIQRDRWKKKEFASVGENFHTNLSQKK